MLRPVHGSILGVEAPFSRRPPFNTVNNWCMKLGTSKFPFSLVEEAAFLFTWSSTMGLMRLQCWSSKVSLNFKSVKASGNYMYHPLNTKKFWKEHIWKCEKFQIFKKDCNKSKQNAWKHQTKTFSTECFVFLHTNIKINIRGLLEKYPTVFFYANTWWIII